MKKVLGFRKNSISWDFKKQDVIDRIVIFNFYASILLCVQTTHKRLSEVYALSSVVVRRAIVFDHSVTVPVNKDVLTKKS